jgi:hypothetical protein
MVAKRGGDALAASASCPPQKFPRRRAFPAIKSFKQPCGLSSRLMDKKVSVSQFLQQARRAPGAKPPPLPRQPPPPQPRPGWPSSGRVSAALLLGLGLCAVAAVIADNLRPAPPAPPRHYDVPQSQGPAAWHDTPPTPAPDRRPVKDFRDQFGSEIRDTVTVTGVTWSPPSQEFGFTISNANPFPVKSKMWIYRADWLHRAAPRWEIRSLRSMRSCPPTGEHLPASSSMNSLT